MLHRINCVLVIDDDPISAFVAQGVFRRADLSDRIECFSNGMDALAFISSYIKEHSVCPEMIVADINMPGMDGFELIGMINALSAKNMAQVVLIGLTAQIKEEWKTNFSDFRQILAKPLTVMQARQLHETHFFNKAGEQEFDSN